MALWLTSAPAEASEEAQARPDDDERLLSEVRGMSDGELESFLMDELAKP